MATIQANQDAAEDVNDFLQRIRDQNADRDREDGERTRRLEEEIWQARRERQARRAERARSLSPTKDSPSTTPQTPRAAIPCPGDASMDQTMQSSLEMPPSPRPVPSRELNINDALRRLADASPSTPVNPAEPQKSTIDTDHTEVPTPVNAGPYSDSAAAPARGPLLSWQRRPDSRPLNGPRALPSPTAPMGATISPASSEPSPLRASSAEESETSRAAIALSLESKDPSWFRQTPDRVGCSAANRRIEGQHERDASSVERKMPLPGMTPDTTSSRLGHYTTLAKTPQSPLENHNKSSLGREPSPSSLRIRETSPAILTPKDIKSPLPTTAAHRLDPPSMEATNRPGHDSPTGFDRGRVMIMSPNSGRISPERLERSMSPTKGLGGFVQSAMMKRSDSVNKRWSAQPGAGLHRVDSVASNRSGHRASGSMSGPFSPPGQMYARSSNLSRETSPVSTSRPGSSRGTDGTMTDLKENHCPLSPGNHERPEADFVKPALPDLNRSQSVMSPGESSEGSMARRLIRTTPPSSPTKYGDSRRWSPTKSSWLETALSKGPEPPKPLKPAPNTQPAWMTDMAKSRTQSVSSETSSAHKEVNTAGLMRAPPIGGFPKPMPPAAGAGSIATPFSSSANLSTPSKQASTATTEVQTISDGDHRNDGVISPPPKPATLMSSPISVTTTDRPTKTITSSTSTPSAMISSLPALTKSISTPSPPAIKPKPASTVPSLDFRSSLKSRTPPSASSSSSQPEFLAGLNKLKRATTSNYVAPDILKSNILRGKSQLQATGVPKRFDRRDDFLESVIQKKDQMAAQKTGESRSRSGSGTARQVEPPEALLTRERLSKTTREIGPREQETPEAVMRRQTLRRGGSPVAGGLQSSEVSKGGLVAKFHPGLAQALARGPPSAANSSVGSSVDNPGRKVSMVSVDSLVRSVGSGATGTRLSHPTKDRARGPKRRVPSEKTA